MKTLFAAVLAALSFTASAQEWILLDESPDGSVRLFSQAQSGEISRNKNDVLVVSATFAITRNGERYVFTAVTGVTTCPNGGEIIYGRTGELIERQWWDATGKRLYDTMGKLLCAVVELEAKRSKKKDKPTTGV